MILEIMTGDGMELGCPIDRLQDEVEKLNKENMIRMIQIILMIMIMIRVIMMM